MSNLFSLDINKKTVKRIEINKDSISEVEKELLINIKKYKLNAIYFQLPKIIHLSIFS